MTRAVLVALFSLFTVACGSLQVDMSKVVAPPPHADDAIRAVYDMYGMRSMPTIYWYGDAALTCDAGGEGGFMYNGACRTGEHEHGEIIVVAVSGNLISDELDQFGYVTLAHEMEHEESEQRSGDPCNDHKCPVFQPGGELERASAMLDGMGI